MSAVDEVLASGTFVGMRSAPGVPVRYALEVGTASIPLNDLLGHAIHFAVDGRIACRYCGATTRKSYGDGYCYQCFRSLARCDLCVVSPDRCHYAAGTCREPAWGDAFCMQPHLVYVANSGGAKVGITKRENVPYRWLDQGATQAAVILHTQTRHQAGCVEAAFARHVADKTDWRDLIGRDAAPIDLDVLATQLRARARPALDALEARFAGAFEWVETPLTQTFEYPVSSYDGAATVLTPTVSAPVGGVLLGIKGQYLLFDAGVLNVRRLTSYHVDVVRRDGRGASLALPSSVRDQMELF